MLVAWRVEKGEGQFCSRVCRDLGAHVARRDPPEIRLSSRYYGWSWRAAQREARERDGCCVDCGISPELAGAALDVHHIVPFKRFGIRRHREANALANLVTLCRPCHIRREWATNWRE
jgi:5-methylcytosine-specific restriction endonuclease McrA